MKTFYCLPLVLLLLGCPAARAVTADGSMWNATTVGDVGYLPLEDLRSFYKFMPLSEGIPGAQSMGNGSISLRFGPDPRELSIRGTRCILSHPVKQDPTQGLLVSKADMVKLIDPVLRPTYIPNRRLVKTVVIDPAHGGHDAGTVVNNVREADIALLVANKLRTELTKRGYHVVLTHEDSRYVSDQQRVDIANKELNPIFVSLHLNKGRSDMHGIETYTATPADPSGKPLPGNEYDAANAALAVALQSALTAQTGAADGACRRVRYSLLSSLSCPAAMVELGYATHKEEGEQLSSDEYQEKLADGLAAGIDAFARVMDPDTQLQAAPKPAAEELTPAKVDPAPPAPKAEPKGTKKTAKPSSKPSAKPAPKPTAKPSPRPSAKPAAKPAPKPAGKGKTRG